MTEHSGHGGDELVAVLYEIGGRYRTGDDRRVIDVYASDLDGGNGGPLSVEQARINYRAHRDRLAARRGGGS